MLSGLLVVVLALQAPDTSVRLAGFVRMTSESGDSGVAQLLLAYPLAVGGGSVRALTLSGEPSRWSRFADRYVEAQGVLVPPSTLDSPRVREARPPGEGRREVDPSFTEHAIATLAIVPQRVRWRDARGGPTGVAVSAYYTIRNTGHTELVFLFGSTDILCIAVTRQGQSDANWRDTWRPARPNERVHVEMSAAVRYLASIPESAAPTPGRYVAHVSLCGNPNYEVSAEFEVAEPGS